MKVGVIAILLAGLACACAAPQRSVEKQSSATTEITSVSSSGVVVRVRNRVVRAPAPDGRCVYPGTAGMSDGAAHVLIGACEFYQPRSQATPVALSVRADKGLFSVTVQGEALRVQGQRYGAALAMLEKLLAADDQRTQAATNTAKLTSVSRDAEAVYVVVDSVNGRLCRAFTELNGRLAAISYIGAPAGESDAEMMASLVRYVRFLRQANGHSAVTSG